MDTIHNTIKANRDLERIKGLRAHFSEAECKDSVELKALENRVNKARAKAGRENIEIEKIYYLDTLNPINRYKHTHKKPDRVPVTSPKDKKGSYIVSSSKKRHGKRTIKLEKTY